VAPHLKPKNFGVTTDGLWGVFPAVFSRPGLRLFYVTPLFAGKPFFFGMSLPTSKQGHRIDQGDCVGRAIPVAGRSRTDTPNTYQPRRQFSQIHGKKWQRSSRIKVSFEFTWFLSSWPAPSYLPGLIGKSRDTNTKYIVLQSASSMTYYLSRQ
jgi:hypothetical protein